MSDNKSKYTKESAIAKLFANGIEVREREIISHNLIIAVADRIANKTRVERIIQLQKSPGIKMWGAIDYLVKNHKFQIIWT